jgi:hypothetical protein
MAELKNKEEKPVVSGEPILMAESSKKEEKAVRRKRKLKPPAKWGKIKRSLIEKAVREVIAERSLS